MIPRIILAALTGLVLEPLSGSLAGLLLKKRGRQLTRGREERLLSGAVLTLLGAGIGWLYEPLFEGLYLFLLLLVCAVAAITDIHHRIIPNETVLAILALTLLFGIPGLCGAAGFPRFRPGRAFLGLAVCMVIFFLPALFGKSVGAGDVKLAGAMGFCLGLGFSLGAVVLMGALVLAFVFLQNRLPTLQFVKTRIPLGPFLGLSLCLVLLLSRLPGLEGVFGLLAF